MNLLWRIERHMRRYNIAPTRFGRDAAGDPRLVSDLRNGRQPGRKICARIVDHIVAREQEGGSCG